MDHPYISITVQIFESHVREAHPDECFICDLCGRNFSGNIGDLSLADLCHEVLDWPGIGRKSALSDSLGGSLKMGLTNYRCVSRRVAAK